MEIGKEVDKTVLTNKNNKRLIMRKIYSVFTVRMHKQNYNILLDSKTYSMKGMKKL
jgi:hypothetical protein